MRSGGGGLFVSDSDKAMLHRALTQGMRDEVSLILFVDDTGVSKDLVELAEMLAGITPKVKVDVQKVEDGKNQRFKDMRLEHWPVMILSREEFLRIRYYGVPLGYELPAIADGLVDLSNLRTPLSPKAKAASARTSGFSS